MLNSFIYKSSPIIVQNIALSCYELIKRKMRATDSSRQLMKQLIDHEKDTQALNEYHDNKLKSVLNNAVLNSQFYKKSILIFSIHLIG